MALPGRKTATAVGSYPLMVRGVAWRSSDGRTWELLPGDTVAVSEAGLSRVAYGPVAVFELDDRLVIAGTTPDLGATLWVESAIAE
jgi:hypothetical protein